MATVSGTAWVETAYTKLNTLMEALKTTMADGYTPTFSYVYSRHDVANLQLNAVTYEIEDVNNTDPSWTAQDTTGDMYYMTFSVRVHTGYVDDKMDGLDNARLLNSIANKLLANKNMGDSYRVVRIEGMNSRVTFENTIGGELTVVISVFEEQTQE